MAPSKAPAADASAKAKAKAKPPPKPVATSSDKGFESHVPLKKTRTHDEVLAPSTFEDVAAGQELRASTYKCMRSIIPFVQTTMPDRLRTLGMTGLETLVSCGPLQISEAQSLDITGYKEAWSPANCRTAITTTGLYEAGGNLTWLDLSLGTAGQPGDMIPREEPSWMLIKSYAEQFFSTASVITLSDPKHAERRVPRLLFPSTLDTYVLSQDALWGPKIALVPGKEYPHQLFLVAKQSLVFAWYYAAACALRDERDDMLKALWQCALSVTLRVRVEAQQIELIAFSMSISEEMKSHEKGMSDSFVTFSEKALALVGSDGQRASGQKIADILNSRHVTFNGMKMNRNIALAAQTVHGVLTVAVKTVLTSMDRHHGRDVVSNSYTKLARMTQMARAYSNPPTDASTIMLFVLQCMHMTLDRKLETAKWFTLEVMEKNKHDGSAGWFGMSAAKYWMLQHIWSLTECLTSDKETIVNTLQGAFADPVVFHARFPLTETAEKPADDEPDAVDEEACADPAAHASDDPLSPLCEKLPKVGSFLADMLHSLYCGDFDADLKTLGSKPQPWLSVQAELDQLGACGKQMREFMRLASDSTTLVSIGSQAAPGPSMRQLARISSDPGGVSQGEQLEQMKKERADLWKKARAQRQRFVQLALWKTRTKEGLEAVVQKAKSVASFAGKLNETHRAFICSMDLLQEADAQPWATACVPKGAAVDARMSFLCSREGPTDFAFAFDGRSRTVRRVLEDTFEASKKSVEEVWVIYQDSGGPTRSRKTCLGSNTREVVFCKLPCPRARLTLKPREAFAAAGETSTHHTTWTGVPLPSLTRLPRLTVGDKKLINPSLTEDGAAPPKWELQGVPLFWNESKSVAFWAAFLQAWDVQAVCDLSPGSGALASACMSLGIQFLGICEDDHHLSWLSNTCDRASLKYITEHGTAMFQQELSDLITEQFADILEELNAEDVPQEGEGSCDDDDGA